MRFTPWLSSIQSRVRRHHAMKSRRRTGRRSPRFEPLEPRILLTISTSFDVISGELTVTSDADDAIAVNVSSGEVTVNGTGTGVTATDVLKLDVNGGAGANSIDLSAVNATTFPNLTEVDIDGGAGADTMQGSA